MELGIFAKTFAGDIEANMAAVSASGLSSVQYNLSIAGIPTVPGEVPREVITRIARAADEHHVKIAAISGTFNIAHPDTAVRERGLARFPVLARAAVDLKIPVITLSSGTRNADDMWAPHPENTSSQAWQDSLAALRRLVDIAEGEGVRIAFEPEHTNIVATAEQGRAMLDEIGSDALQVVFDAANLLDTEDLTLESMRRTVSRSVQLLEGHIALAHAKELVADRSAVPPGAGVLPWREIVDDLRASGYDGAFVMHGLAVSAVPTGRQTLAPLLDEEQ